MNGIYKQQKTRLTATKARAAYESWISKEAKAKKEKENAFTEYTETFYEENPIVYLVVNVGVPRPMPKGLFGGQPISDIQWGNTYEPIVCGIYTKPEYATKNIHIDMSVMTQKRYQCIIPVYVDYVKKHGLLAVMSPDTPLPRGVGYPFSP